MRTASTPRIALLAHSTNPRGGVVHALELGDALARLGLSATVHAPDVRGTGFFRKALCSTVTVQATPAPGDTTAMVEVRVADYLRHFDVAAHRRFDVFHAQDGISGNALATLKERGLIRGFARTVHHVDQFADPRLSALQVRAITMADQLFVVSRLVRDEIARRFDRPATIVGNGVDAKRFQPKPDGRESLLADWLKLEPGAPVYLSIGGVEARKNSLRILEAFLQVRQIQPAARLIIAGGASVLDHLAYQAEFTRILSVSDLPPTAVIVTGPIPQSDMPALYRLATALVFPSLQEGFGLVVLEAMASGVPVVTSAIPPFTEYLGESDVLWCDPLSSASIADAMLLALVEPLRQRLIDHGRAVVTRHDWRRTAEAHLGVYETMRDLSDA